MDSFLRACEVTPQQAVGVNSHKRSLAAVAVDELGHELGRREFPNDATEHRQALGWARSMGGAGRTFGIEGSGRYGAGLAAYLLAADEEVYEVPSFLSHRERRKAPSKGKSDLSDATAIARIVARGEGLVPLRGARLHEDLRLLSDHRDQPGSLPNAGRQPGPQGPLDHAPWL